MTKFILTMTLGIVLIGIVLSSILLGTMQMLVTFPHTGRSNTSVVEAALSMASQLYNCPPDNYDQCWSPSFPQTALAFWQKTCPGCSAWQNGNLQCVMLVSAAYGIAGEPLPALGNAIDFWSLYSHRSGWREIPSGSSPPLPGDMMVLSSPYFGGVGHIAIVTDVQVPTDTHTGSITIAQANGPGPINVFPLPHNLVVTTWTNYTTLGFIRSATNAQHPLS